MKFREWLVAQIENSDEGMTTMGALAFKLALVEYDREIAQAPKVYQPGHTNRDDWSVYKPSSLATKYKVAHLVDIRKIGGGE